jgi:hypothetical protein
MHDRQILTIVHEEQWIPAHWKKTVQLRHVNVYVHLAHKGM